MSWKLEHKIAHLSWKYCHLDKFHDVLKFEILISKHRILVGKFVTKVVLSYYVLSKLWASFSSGV